jgi:hypothetical protein
MTRIIIGNPLVMAARPLGCPGRAIHPERFRAHPFFAEQISATISHTGSSECTNG